ncbi:hypothetical protein SAY86_010451 [Trapa natans]|uniref:Mechanosensitive ion channel MscS domain-containing protein n=1 Tax=Trapa natans TaxID=22666 RepID=A0AAN7R5H6_TRANT|nr:hypothetical protein SAY86_010451 [Trapa natans]
MAGVIFSRLKSCSRFTGATSEFRLLLSRDSYMSSYCCPVASPAIRNLPSPHARTLASVSCLDNFHYKNRPADASLSVFSRAQIGIAVHSISIGTGFNYRSYSSFFSGKGDKQRDGEVSAVSSTGEMGQGDTGVIGNDWVDKLKDAWHGTLDAAGYAGQKVREASDELSPYAHQLFESHPYLKNVILPVTYTLVATLLAWVVMPRILRRFHNYALQGHAALFPGTLLGEQVPYEKSLWGALEDPIRYLFTFIAFSQIAVMVAPKVISSQYIVEAWRGAVVLSFLWFLYRWKSNVFSRALAAKSLAVLDRERLIALDKLSSVGLLAIGIMALAEACGVPLQSIITVGGIGGVATAFAARDVLGNVLSGLSIQFSKPFSLGDTIKAGSIEGQVMDMGLTTTSLLNAEKFPVIVPNSLFSSQVIVNKSRAEWRAMVIKIPLRSDDVDKIPQVTNDIKNMLKVHPKVFLGKEIPYCYLSRVENLYAELTLGCNLTQMSKDELYSAQQDILLQAVQIIKQHGAKLGSTTYDTSIP